MAEFQQQSAAERIAKEGRGGRKVSIYVLHGNEPGTEQLLRHLQVPHGTALPSGEFGGRVVVWGTHKAEAVAAAARKQLKAAREAEERTLRAAQTGPQDEAQRDTAAASKPGKVAGLWAAAKPSPSSPSSDGRRRGKLGGAKHGEEGPNAVGIRAAGGAEQHAETSSAKLAPAKVTGRAQLRQQAASSEATARTVLEGGAGAATALYGSAQPKGSADMNGDEPPATARGSVAAGVEQALKAPVTAAPLPYDSFLALPQLPDEPLRRLRAHGIEVDERTFGAASEKEVLRGASAEAEALRDYPYVYRVPVFHLEALTLFRLQRDTLLLPGGGRQKPGAFVEVGLDQPTYPSRCAVREAVKALYALGLEFGEAVVGIRPAGRAAVLAVWAQPDAGLGALYAEAIGRYGADYARERQRTEPAMLGTDPEFLLVNPAGKVVAASRYLERDGEVGCDAIVVRGRRVITPLAELRPRPSHSPRQLAANLRRALRLAAARIGDASLNWLAGGMPLRGFPLGGHIHFSGVWLNSHLLRALDNYLALPLLLIEADTARQRRPRYGCLGDFRRQPHGGFEYRTLPSWIVTPQVAVGVLSLARVIADGYRELPGGGIGGAGTYSGSEAGAGRSPDGARDSSGSTSAAGAGGTPHPVPARPLDDIRLLEAYYSGDKTALQLVVAELWRRLERLPGYAEFAADLEPLRARTLRMEPWSETDDLRRAWKIPPFDGSRSLQRQIML